MFINNKDYNERDLIKKCLEKSDLAQKILFSKIYPKIKGMALRYFKEDEEVLDVVQEAMIKIFENLHKYNDEYPFEPWAKRVALNYIIDFFKRKKKLSKKFVSTQELENYPLENMHDDLVSKNWDEITKINISELLSFIKQLPQATMTVFNLYAIEGFTHEEIAQKLDISVSTSKWHLFNARNILKEKIKTYFERQQSTSKNKAYH